MTLAVTPVQTKIQVSLEKGNVSTRLDQPRNPRCVVVLGHGAGAGMEHAHMNAIAGSLNQAGAATLRYHFPYKERGGSRTDTKDVCCQTIAAAIEMALELLPGKPLILAGHSFGGRMSSHYAADHPDVPVAGLVYFSFPLHAAGKPGIARAEHLYAIDLPMLFLSGTRDSLGKTALLQDVTWKLKKGTLHLLDTADHGFRILKRTRRGPEDVYQESTRILTGWLTKHLGIP